MQKFKALIFDIDGTLANTVPLCVQAFRRAMEPQLHRTLSSEEIIAAFGPDEEGTLQSFAPPDSQKALADFMHFYTALHKEMCPLPFNGIENLLEKLERKGVHLAVATGKSKATSEYSLKLFNIFKYFTVMQNGAPEGSRKPEAIQDIITAFSVQKDETLYIGDSAGDIKESREAGIHVVGAAWAETAEKEKLANEQPDALFESVEDFAEWLYKRI